MEKKFDTIKLIRNIRNKIYEEIKDMTPEERIQYLNDRGKAAEEKLKNEVNLLHRH